ncbi:hypothetical protein [Endozoicomonas acroporae]|uniref:hypothetical protein n=1 Tax=Endozoicomonas acroporae TaxID=1701104 RepID=UPI0013D25854|nr:hypothetical protein [Endozoicomonas acroporae]
MPEVKNGDLNAFPCLESGYEELGLTKREYFAIKALQGILADSSMNHSKACTTLAIKYADMLLIELELTQ